MLSLHTSLLLLAAASALATGPSKALWNDPSVDTVKLAVNGTNLVHDITAMDLTDPPALLAALNVSAADDLWLQIEHCDPVTKACTVDHRKITALVAAPAAGAKPMDRNKPKASCAGGPALACCDTDRISILVAASWCGCCAGASPHDVAF